jgi:hypothetical protein
MMATQNDNALIQAVNRNTRATRAIAILLVGWIPGLILGAVIAAIGGVTAPYNPSTGGMLIVFGVLIFTVSALIAIWMAWVELRRSSFDSGPENSTSSSIKSDGTASAKNWLKE